MPELPEVETMRRGVKCIAGATIEKARRTPCKKKPIDIVPRIDLLSRKVAGHKIAAVDRLGKRVVIRIDNGDRIILEPRMTGIVLVGEPPNTEHLRFELLLKNSKAERLLFWDRRGLGKVTWLSGEQFQEKLASGDLGPDAIEISSEEFRQRGKQSKREIKVALLDQKFIAGVGNLYASEILHVAGVDPRARCHRLTIKQWTAIHECMIEILNTAIRYEGSTLSDGTYQKAINDPGGYQNHHRVYDRAGKNCPSCRNASIQRIVQAQRSTFFCKKCQKR
ncbi:MAG: DNA-formamidopyrimidine glycosylase [Planctomycetota bacterium]